MLGQDGSCRICLELGDGGCDVFVRWLRRLGLKSLEGCRWSSRSDVNDFVLEARG